MSFQHCHLRFADQLDLGQEPPDTLHVLRASGRGIGMRVPAGWISLWVPLSGELHLESAASHWCIRAREMLVWRDGPLHACSHSRAWWLGLAGTHPAWSRHLPQRGGLEILPWQSRGPRELRRLMVRIAKSVRSDDPGRDMVAALTESLCAALIEQQRPLDRHLERCSGRTLQRRQQTLLRLLRVRHLIRTHPEGRMDLARLAESANYSPCHLIRVHRQVFDETPSEYATRLRTRRAWEMVRDTQLPVCEITEALGFESQSAFCRAFKKSFGVTTSQARDESMRSTQLAA